MQTRAKNYLTPEEYLAIERAAEYKSEYFGGEMFALAGAGLQHNRIAANLMRSLGNLLWDGPREAFGSDMRVKVNAFDKYTYPDAVVGCGELHFEGGRQDTLLNPLVIIEVLSPSTEAYDRGIKFEHYRRIESLREYVLVAQDRAYIERYQRIDDGRWVISYFHGLDSTLPLESISCDLPLVDIYHKVDFPSDMPEPDSAA